MRCHMPLLFVPVLWLVGCSATTYRGYRPVYPNHDHWRQMVPGVPEVQPTFRWEPKEPGETYDFILWELRGRCDGSSKMGYNHIAADGGTRNVSDSRRGRVLYEKRGIPVPWHKLGIVLEPGKPYWWSVRKTTSTNDGRWSTFDHDENKYHPNSLRLTNSPFVFYVHHNAKR